MYQSLNIAIETVVSLEKFEKAQREEPYTAFYRKRK